VVVPQWFIDLAVHPQLVKQHGQLSRHRHDRSFLGILYSALGQPQPPSPQIAVFSKRPQNVVRPLHHQGSQVTVSFLADVELGLAAARIPAPGTQPQIAHVAAAAKSVRVFQRQHIGQGDQRSHTFQPATGTSALLDKWTVAKPELGSSVDAKLVAPDKVDAGQNFKYVVTIRNNSQYALNGTQVRLELPGDVTFAGTLGDSVTLQGDEVVVTVGRVAVGGEQTIEIPVQVSLNARRNEHVFTSGEISSSTALPVMTNKAATSIEP
jgi:uncharacterized repeat protein (TIGR01451 family)